MIVSIVIPTFERGGLVGEAVRSVLDQTVANLEVIVVDDGSTDGTASVIERLAAVDARVRYVWQRNAGRSAARNHGLEMAQGSYVGFLDSDDELEPWALQAHLDVMEQDGLSGMTIAGYRLVDVTGRVLEERRPWLSGGALDLAGWLFDCYGLPGSVLHRRGWLEAAGGFDENLDMAEDWDLYLRLAAAECPMRFVERVTCRYRQHGGSSMSDLERHWDRSILVVERLFRNGELTAAVRSVESSALVWLELVAARRGIVAGALDFARARLRDATARDRDMVAADKERALEFLLAPGPGGRQLDESAIEIVAQCIGANGHELRSAMARAHMGQFFRAASAHDWSMARSSLVQGIRSDYRWLFNRGVVKIGLRAIGLLPCNTDMVRIDGR